MTENSEQPAAFTSPIYGPVKSWRFGNSLGIDLLLVDSICSFNCIYCQLGDIHQVIDEQKIFVPTERVIAELDRVEMKSVDIVTFSGNGEPTLALNIGEVIEHFHHHHSKPSLVLTNATWLHDAATRARLRHASIVDCKLDATSNEMLRKYNRAAPGITIDRIVAGIKAMRNEPGFTGKVTIQCMFMPMNKGEVHRLAEIIREIQPAEVQLNTPRRPHPREWYVGARGNHYGDSPVETTALKTITLEEAEAIEATLREITGVPVRSIYRRAPGQ